MCHDGGRTCASWDGEEGRRAGAGVCAYKIQRVGMQICTKFQIHIVARSATRLGQGFKLMRIGPYLRLSIPSWFRYWFVVSRVLTSDLLLPFLFLYGFQAPRCADAVCYFPSRIRATSDPSSSSMGLLILASFQANSHSPSKFLYSFRSTAPTAATSQCCVSSPRPPAPAPAADTTTHSHLPLLARVRLPSAHPCSAAPFSLSPVRSVDWVTQHKHKCLSSLPLAACLSTPAG